MAVICPTILTNDANKYRLFVEAYRNFATRVQVDIVDGVFAPNKTIDVGGVWWPTGWTVDIHMMVTNPSQYIDTLVKLKPNLVIFHAEAQEDLVPSFTRLRSAGIKCGVAFLKTTFPGRYADVIRGVEHVLLFSGNLGQYGGEADLLQLEKIPAIKGINSHVEIGWDGGVKLSNAWELARGGVDVLNVGSAIAGAERPRTVYEAMLAEANKGAEI
jgi:ribulose-phosphate 3-epimerase